MKLLGRGPAHGIVVLCSPLDIAQHSALHSEIIEFLEKQPEEAVSGCRLYARRTKRLGHRQITNTLEIPEWGLPNNTNYADQNGRLLAPNGLTFDKSGTIVTGANYVLPPAGVGCNSTVNPVTGASRQAVDRPSPRLRPACRLE